MSDDPGCNCAGFAALFGSNNTGFEYYNGWHLNGCCGGGCYVLENVKFCPFCGRELKIPCTIEELPEVLAKWGEGK